MSTPDSRPSLALVLVEDSPDDAELIGFALRNAPFRFSARRVETREQLVAALEAQPPDAVLCDYHLPRFGMQEALHLVRVERAMDVPFIVVSRLIGEDAAVQAMRDGADDYLLKGRLGRLGAAIEAAVERQRSRAAREAAEAALRRADLLNRSLLKSLAMRIAVLDGDGRLLALNPAWSRDGRGVPAIGADFLAYMRSGDAAADVVEALCEGIRSVMARRQPGFVMEYAVGGAGLQRWSMLRAEPLEDTQHGAVVSVEDITPRMLSQVALRNAHDRLQHLSRRVLAVQEEERRAIALELHDDIGQSLAALKIALHALGARLSDAEGARLRQCLDIAEQALDKLRRLATSLRPPQLDQLGLQVALSWLAQQHAKATGLSVQCEIPPLERRPPPTVEVACYRIVQEALNNATRHGEATSAAIDLRVQDRLLSLSVRDNGKGFDPVDAQDRAVRRGSLGLIGMAERAQLAGGTLRIRSVEGAGTTVSAIFPMEAARAG